MDKNIKYQTWMGNFLVGLLAFFISLFFGNSFILGKEPLVSADAYSEANQYVVNHQSTPVNDKLGTNDMGYTEEFKYNTTSQFKKSWNYQLSMIKKMPFKWLRIGTNYAIVKTNTSGKYDFSKVDYQIKTAQKAGLKVVFPLWSDALIGDTYSQRLSQTENLWKQLVKHEAGKGIYWEGIDEAESGGTFWFNEKPSEQKTKDVIKVDQNLRKIVHKYDPKASFINGDLAGSSDHADYAFSHGIFKGSKLGSFHTYMTGSPEPILTNWSAKHINLLEKQGISPIIDELGYPYAKDFNGTYTRKQQSDYLIREIFLLDMLGVKSIQPFCMEDTNLDWSLETSHKRPGKGNLVLATQDIRKKFNQLSGYSFNHRIQTNTDDYVLVYSKKNASNKYVYWTTTDKHQVKANKQTFTLTTSPQVFSNTDKKSQKPNLKTLKGNATNQQNTLAQANGNKISLPAKYNNATFKQLETSYTGTGPWEFDDGNYYLDGNTFASSMKSIDAAGLKNNHFKHSTADQKVILHNASDVNKYQSALSKFTVDQIVALRKEMGNTQSMPEYDASSEKSALAYASGKIKDDSGIKGADISNAYNVFSNDPVLPAKSDKDWNISLDKVKEIIFNSLVKIAFSSDKQIGFIHNQGTLSEAINGKSYLDSKPAPESYCYWWSEVLNGYNGKDIDSGAWNRTLWPQVENKQKLGLAVTKNKQVILVSDQNFNTDYTDYGSGNDDSSY